MAANWRAIGDFLRDQDGPVTLSWERLAEIVGGLPASATNHRAWWSGDRPHVNVWRSAGFRVGDLQQGRSVTFARHEHAQRLTDPSGPRPERSAEVAGRASDPSPSALLVTCVKSKRSTPSAAKDLYTSPLFLNQRAYAEASGRPWFILSAEHGLVEPDEWLAPYERYLPDTSRSYREAWGHRMVLTIAASQIAEAWFSPQTARACARDWSTTMVDKPDPPPSDGSEGSDGRG